MQPEHWTARRLRFTLWVAGAVAAFGVVGAVLSTLRAPETVTWAAAAGAAVAGGWAGERFMRRLEERR
ncbi:hypothetical protein NHG22_29710 [Streptomyces sp. ATE26]|uniref:hypothetical protein n=1 Tax=unclassified Streptomyces TaxID=2593676 RepID=UPI002482CA9E|nr:hypothetical protein [Streptomyces sp. ATE26]MDI1457949.1 hypothetical protein [Streptomyces sp. ATE26]